MPRISRLAAARAGLGVSLVVCRFCGGLDELERAVALVVAPARDYGAATCAPGAAYRRVAYALLDALDARDAARELRRVGARRRARRELARGREARARLREAVG